MKSAANYRDIAWQICHKRDRTAPGWQITRIAAALADIESAAQSGNDFRIVVEQATDPSGTYTAEDGLRRAREIALQAQAAPFCMGEIVKVADKALGETTPLPEWMVGSAPGPRPVAWRHRGPKGGWITTEEKREWSESALYSQEQMDAVRQGRDQVRAVLERDRIRTEARAQQAEQRSERLDIRHEAWRKHLNRLATVEGYLRRAAKGETPLPGAEQCQEWALKIGIPDELRPLMDDDVIVRAGSLGLVLEVTENALLEWLRTLADRAGYADRAVLDVQLREQDGRTPRLVCVVSPEPGTRKDPTRQVPANTTKAAK